MTSAKNFSIMQADVREQRRKKLIRLKVNAKRVFQGNEKKWLILRHVEFEKHNSRLKYIIINK